MKYSLKILCGGIVVVSSFIALTKVELSLAAPPARAKTNEAKAGRITIDYPVEGSIFPPEITPPTFLFHDRSDATHWRIQISFEGYPSMIREAAGEHMKMGEIDPEAAPVNEFSQLTAQQADARTWVPDSDLWAKMKHQSVGSRVSVSITGLSAASEPVSFGSVKISVSADKVGAPIFYRDVALMLSPPSEKGVIQPLPPSAIPLIKWKLRNIGESQSRTVMQNLVTCANCHSFSADGKTLAMDLDGPRNDKGLYAIAPVAKNMTIRNQDVIRWSSLLSDRAGETPEPAVKRFGFMSQISPDGRYVVTSIAPPNVEHKNQNELTDFAPGLADRLFSMNYNDIRFIQVFYPTRGVLAYYDRKEGRLHYLPGADDPRFVHTSAFWSPDGKYLIFSRATARDPYPNGATQPVRANDPAEPEIQYDLYRIPFNEGRGGSAEPITGASANGMSNNFPKVSPDGRWIVFVQNKNGLLMRPDSKLYIVPFEGGKARLMNCNTALMNSWHSFSPNGHWMAFSSKARSPHTQLMLTHIDADGNDSPPIIVDNTTAANRAVNIPEFVNIPPDGIIKIDPEAAEIYRLFNQAYVDIERRDMPKAVGAMRKALEYDPNDALAHYALATALSGNHQESEAVEEYRRACALKPDVASWQAHLAVSLAATGHLQEAITAWRKALELNPNDAGAEADLGTALFEVGNSVEGYEHLQKSIAMVPDFAEAHSRLGWELSKIGRLDEAIDELRKATDINPRSFEFLVNLGFVLGMKGNIRGSVAAFEKAVDVSEGKDWRCLDLLARAYSKANRTRDAAYAERRALALVQQQHDEELEQRLRNNLQRYERKAPRK